MKSRGDLVSSFKPVLALVAKFQRRRGNGGSWRPGWSWANPPSLWDNTVCTSPGKFRIHQTQILSWYWNEVSWQCHFPNLVSWVSFSFFSDLSWLNLLEYFAGLNARMRIGSSLFGMWLWWCFCGSGHFGGEEEGRMWQEQQLIWNSFGMNWELGLNNMGIKGESRRIRVKNKMGQVVNGVGINCE